MLEKRDLKGWHVDVLSSYSHHKFTQSQQALEVKVNRESSLALSSVFTWEGSGCRLPEAAMILM